MRPFQRFKYIQAGLANEFVMNLSIFAKNSNYTSCCDMLFR